MSISCYSTPLHFIFYADKPVIIDEKFLLKILCSVYPKQVELNICTAFLHIFSFAEKIQYILKLIFLSNKARFHLHTSENVKTKQNLFRPPDNSYVKFSLKLNPII